MPTARRLAALAALSGLAAGTVLPPGPAAAAAPAATVGGEQLAGRGVIANTAPGVPKVPNIAASSWIIADNDTGQVLAAKDPHGQYLPASALKTLTSITLIPKLDPESTVHPSQQACDVAGTRVGMTPKLGYKIKDLFNALLLMSANDAAVTLTEAGGGYKQTITAMNAEARRLQAGDTLAASPNGLDVDLGLSLKTQHSSSYDLALFLKQGLTLPDFRTYVGTVNATFPAEPSKADRKKGRKLGSMPIYSHDRLLPGEPMHYNGMIGGKNGYTVHSLQTFVGAAKRNGHTIIIALMHGDALWPYATQLLDWGFAADGKVQPVGTLVDPVDSQKKTTASTSAMNPAIRTSGTDYTILGLGAAAIAAVLAAAAFVTMRRRRALAGGPVILADAPEEPAAPPSFGSARESTTGAFQDDPSPRDD